MSARILNETELRQAVGINDEALEAVVAAFGWLQQDRVSMPPIMHISAKDKNGDIDVKSAYVEGIPDIAIKISSGFYDNPAKGLPAVSGGIRFWRIVGPGAFLIASIIRASRAAALSGSRSQMTSPRSLVSWVRVRTWGLRSL